MREEGPRTGGEEGLAEAGKQESGTEEKKPLTQRLLRGISYPG